MLFTLGYIASDQAKITEATTKYTTQLLDYCETHPNATTRYMESDMVLRIRSDDS